MISRTRGGVLALVFILSNGAHAQWLRFREPGVPRTPDGQADLRAPVPMDPTGKPDLSRVWMHETTPAEMKRLYGSSIDEEIQVGVPGMEIGTQHKYSRNILLDFKPEEAPVRPQTLERMRCI